jgi:ADP-heptose:LPS heptosyltransferase
MRDRLCYTHPVGVTVPRCGNSFTIAPTGGLMAEYTGLSKLKLLQDRRIDTTDLDLDFYISQADRQEADSFRSRYFDGPVVAIYAASRAKNRRWTSEKFAQLADRLAACGLQVFLVYGPGERPIAHAIADQMQHRAIVEYPDVSFAVLKGILDGCGLYVGVDGGPKHVAVASGIPTVTLFGLIHPESWTAPHRSDQRFVATRADTRPVPTRGRCTEASRLEDISVDQVWERLEDLVGPAREKAA